jgi:hypothetical protein
MSAIEFAQMRREVTCLEFTTTCSTRCQVWTNESLRAKSCGRARTPATSTAKQPMETAPIRSPRWFQLQLVRYDGLAGEALQLQGIEHVLETRSAPRRPVRAPRRPLNDAAAYADLALAGAASAPFHPQVFTDCAKAGAANTIAKATAAISVFMVSLHPTHLR